MFLTNQTTFRQQEMDCEKESLKRLANFIPTCTNQMQFSDPNLPNLVDLYIKTALHPLKISLFSPLDATLTPMGIAPIKTFQKKIIYRILALRSPQYLDCQFPFFLGQLVFQIQLGVAHHSSQFVILKCTYLVLLFQKDLLHGHFQ